MKKFNDITKSLVISFYNESRNIKELISEIENFKKKFTINEVIFVNNSSTDDTGKILQDECINMNYIFINVTNSKGYGDGYFEGIKRSSSEFILTNHSDLQFSFLDLSNFLIDKNPDFSSNNALIPVRYNRKISSYLKTFFLKIIYSFILSIRIADHNGHPKVFPKKILNNISNYPKTGAFDCFIYYLLIKKNYLVYSYKVFERPRKHGVSSFSHSIIRQFKTFINMLSEVKNFKKFTI